MFKNSVNSVGHNFNHDDKKTGLSHDRMFCLATPKSEYEPTNIFKH